ncbi:MAG: redoxin domain-containing protein [Planctomycetes bacterium]|nr:redoxin domain-containing protein [Planctomycetota bacterium]
MERSIWRVAFAAAFAGLIGCNNGSSPVPVAQEAPSRNGNSTVANADTTSSTTATQQQTPGGAPGASPSSAGIAGGLAAGEKPAAAPIGSGKTADTPAAKENDPTLEGINDPRAKSVFQQLKTMLDQAPNDVNARLNMINLLQQIGAMQASGGLRAQGMQRFIESGKMARDMMADGSEIPQPARGLLSQVYYNEACALADSGKNEEAMNSLNEAFALGFSDMKLLNEDPDLANLRKSPEFAVNLKKWETAAQEAGRQRAAEELAGAKSFPFDFQVTDLDGQSHKLADFKGKVLIVDFWGTWCPPCRAELPSFVKLQQTFGPKGFQMIGLNYENDNSEETAEMVRKFNKEQMINYPCALADDAIRAQVPDFGGYPTTLFLDASGKVRLKVVGLHDYAFLEAVVTTLLEESGSTSASGDGADTNSTSASGDGADTK